MALLYWELSNDNYIVPLEILKMISWR